MSKTTTWLVMCRGGDIGPAFFQRGQSLQVGAEVLLFGRRAGKLQEDRMDCLGSGCVRAKDAYAYRSARAAPPLCYQK